MEVTKKAKVRFGEIVEEIWKIKKKEERNLKPEEEDDYSEISDKDNDYKTIEWLISYKDNESNLDQSPEEQSL